MKQGPLPQAFATHTVGVPDGHAEWVRDTQAGDWFVIAHLAFFFLLLGCFAWATWGIWRRTTRPAPHMQLIMELAEEESRDAPTAGVHPSGTSGAAAQPWEKAEDWWKKG
jgi:hypothetical protein